MQPVPARRPKRQPVGFYMSQSTTEIGDFIRQRRLALNMSQKTLAKLINVTQTQISAIEIGTVKRLDAKYIQPFALALECDIDELRRHNPALERREPKSELGKFVRSRREKLGLSLAALSKRSGTPLEEITQLDNGGWKTIPYRLAIPLARALKTNVFCLVRFVGYGDKETTSELGKFIRLQRKAHGMNLSALAQELGVTKQYLSQIELGRYQLARNAWLIQRIIEIFNISSQEIEKITPGRARGQRVPERAPHSPGYYTRRRSPLGQFITDRRLERRLTQTKLGEQAKVHASDISRIELGRRRPNQQMLDKIMAALGCGLPTYLTPRHWPRSSNNRAEG